MKSIENFLDTLDEIRESKAVTSGGGIGFTGSRYVQMGERTEYVDHSIFFVKRALNTVAFGLIIPALTLIPGVHDLANTIVQGSGENLINIVRIASETLGGLNALADGIDVLAVARYNRRNK